MRSANGQVAVAQSIGADVVWYVPTANSKRLLDEFFAENGISAVTVEVR